MGNNGKEMTDVEIDRLYGESAHDVLNDSINKEVFESIHKLTQDSENGKVTYTDLNEHLSYVREAEVLQSIRELTRANLIDEELDVAVQDPANTKTFYKIKEFSSTMENHIQKILEYLNEDVA